MTSTAPVRIWLRQLPVPDGLGVIDGARARKAAAAAALREHLRAELPDVDLAAMRRGRNGKPYLPPPYEHIGFNPSDSGGWWLLGIVDGAQIGVDLELRRPRAKALAIARRHFPSAEVDWLHEQADIDHAFLRLWTLKEALFKAIGRGLGYGLGKPCFQPGADGRLHLVELAGEAAPASAWTCHELALGDGHVGAAVWSGHDRAIRIVQPGRFERRSQRAPGPRDGTGHGAAGGDVSPAGLPGVNSEPGQGLDRRREPDRSTRCRQSRKVVAARMS